MAKQYECLFPKFKDQPPKQVFATFPFNKYLGQTWEHPFKFLAGFAKSEQWNFVRREFRKPHENFPILRMYLNYTFLRLQQEGKIRFTSDGRDACFNTGLQTNDEKDIFAIFSRDERSKTDDSITDWHFEGFYDSYAPQATRFRPLPEIASYITDSSALVLDVQYQIDVNIAHILDDPGNKDRLPEVLQHNRTLAIAAMEGATTLIKQKVLRNYKTAIPFWYVTANKVQLLLPLCLTHPDHADLALVADKNEGGRVYHIRTALRMDMAYSNARLITRPDREWLDP